MPIRKYHHCLHILMVVNYKNRKMCEGECPDYCWFGNKRHTLLSFMHNLYHNAAAAKERLNISPAFRMVCWFYWHWIKTGCGVTDAQEVNDACGSASSAKDRSGYMTVTYWQILTEKCEAEIQFIMQRSVSVLWSGNLQVYH